MIGGWSSDKWRDEERVAVITYWNMYQWKYVCKRVNWSLIYKVGKTKTRRDSRYRTSMWVWEKRITEWLNEKMHLCASAHVYIWKAEASRWGITSKSGRNKTETGRRESAAKKKRGNVYSLLPRWWKDASEEEDVAPSSCLCVHFFLFGQKAFWMVKARKVKTHVGHFQDERILIRGHAAVVKFKITLKIYFSAISPTAY